jgi:hypothetical protein
MKRFSLRLGNASTKSAAGCETGRNPRSNREQQPVAQQGRSLIWVGALRTHDSWMSL